MIVRAPNGRPNSGSVWPLTRRTIHIHSSQPRTSKTAIRAEAVVKKLKPAAHPAKNAYRRLSRRTASHAKANATITGKIAWAVS